MRYLDEYRDRKRVAGAAEAIKTAADRRRVYRFMEVCGTHTMSIARFGLKGLLPGNIKLLSGPGCPVCVTPVSYIDKAIAYARTDGVIVATFGDMVRVPGTVSSLRRARSEGADVKVVYSPLDALKLAQENPESRVVFLGVGFETTAPTIAAAIREARTAGLDNFYVLSGHKVMPPALQALLEGGGVNIDGFILPAHVSAIIGSGPYAFISERYGIPCVIAGFEPLDIMQGICMLTEQIKRGSPSVEIQYERVARPSGNKAAQEIQRDVFSETDSEWRGLGVIPKSGLSIRKKYGRFDAERQLDINSVERGAWSVERKRKGCVCGQVLKGMKEPSDCAHFGRACTPEDPLGPCMVSSEGACSAWYLER